MSSWCVLLCTHRLYRLYGIWKRQCPTRTANKENKMSMDTIPAHYNCNRDLSINEASYDSRSTMSNMKNDEWRRKATLIGKRNGGTFTQLVVCTLQIGSIIFLCRSRKTIDFFRAYWLAIAASITPWTSFSITFNKRILMDIFSRDRYVMWVERERVRWDETERWLTTKNINRETRYHKRKTATPSSKRQHFQKLSSR